MKTRNGFVQGYNGQIVVDCDSQVIVAEELVQDHNDKHQQLPMMEKVEENTGKKPTGREVPLSKQFLDRSRTVDWVNYYSEE